MKNTNFFTVIYRFKNLNFTEMIQVNMLVMLCWRWFLGLMEQNLNFTEMIQVNMLVMLCWRSFFGFDGAELEFRGRDLDVHV